MHARTYAIAATAIAVAGTAFSGYLALTRMTSGMCAFDEPCPFFLGQPACYFGFALFAGLLVVSVAALVTRTRATWAIAANTTLATLGGLFAARMSALESGGHYPMILPTCAWGFVFFVAMLALSLAASVHPTHRPVAP